MQPSICLSDNSFRWREFSPHDVVIKDLKDPKHILATDIADDSTRLYKFDNFGSSCLPSIFVSHNDEVSKLWHEWFGHLNYRSLQTLCKENMVTGLPMVSCWDGVCSGCVLGKHHRDSFDKRASRHASAPLQLAHWFMWSTSCCFFLWLQVLLNFHWWFFQMHLGILKTQEWIF